VRSRFLAAALTATVVAGLAVAGPARALVQVMTTMYTGAVTVHTANGKSWAMSVSVNPNGDGSTDGMRETLVRPLPKTDEGHDWFVSIPDTSLTFDSNSGNGTLKTPQSVAALTTLNLKFTTTSRRNATCTSGSETYYRGNLTGTAILHTQLHAGGTVGGQHVSFAQGKTEVIADSSCVPPSSSNPCYKNVSFQANGASLHTLFGAGAPGPFVELVHSVMLSKPAGSRQDEFSTNSSQAPAFNANKHTLQVWAAASGAFTGTGKFTGGTLSKSAGACTVKGVHHTERLRFYNNAVFRNGANHPLVAHTSLVGTMTVPKTNHTSYEFDTWS
jgi:hypothetical protein